MTTIKKTSFAANLYEYHTKDNYHMMDGVTKKMELIGKGAEALGAAGELDNHTFGEVLNGYRPGSLTKEQLRELHTLNKIEKKLAKKFEDVSAMKAGEEKDKASVEIDAKIAAYNETRENFVRDIETEGLWSKARELEKQIIKNQDGKNPEWLKSAHNELFNLKKQIRDMENSPVPKKKLVDDSINPNNGIMKHSPGWDMTFAPSRDISLCALALDKNEFKDIHNSAVDEAVAYMEKHFLQTRVYEDGKRVNINTESLVAMRIQHLTNRAVDTESLPEMHLHDHVHVMNMTEGRNGEWASVNSKPLYDGYKEVLSQVYQNALARGINQLNNEFSVQPQDVNGTVVAKLKGMPQDLVKNVSQRTVRINEKISEKEEQIGRALTPEEKKRVSITDRVYKKQLDMDVVKGSWDEKILEAGYHKEEVLELLSGHTGMRAIVNTPEEAVSIAVEHLTRTSSVFTTQELVKHSMRASFGLFTPDQIMGGIEKKKGKTADALIEKTDIFLVGSSNTETVFSSKEILEAEANIEMRIAKGRGTGKFFDETEFKKMFETANAKKKEEMGDNYFELTAQQKGALELIATSNDKYIGIQGDAGSGKTSAIEMYARIIQEANTLLGDKVEVVAGTPTGKASSVFENTTGLKTETIDYLLHRISNKKDDKAYLFFLDESSMVDSIKLDKLMRLAEERNSKVVLIGDTKQQPPIGAGYPFRRAQDKGIMEFAHVTEVHRQKSSPFFKEMAEDIKSPENVGSVLRKMDAAGCVRHLPDEKSFDEFISDDISREVADAYMKYGLRDNKVGLVVGTNKARDLANIKIRENLQEAGVVDTTNSNMTSLAKKELDTIQLRTSNSYKIGDVLRPNQMLGDIKYGQQLSVKDINHASNSVLVEFKKGKNGVGSKWLPIEQNYNKWDVYEQVNRDWAVGDKVLFRKNIGKHKNGHTGVIIGVDSKNEKLIIEKTTVSGKKEKSTLSIKEYPFLDYGYALTTGAAQGEGFDHLFAVLNSKSKTADYQEFYTQFTRLKKSGVFFVDDLKGVEQKYSQVEEKKNASDFVDNKEFADHKIDSVKYSFESLREKAMAEREEMDYIKHLSAVEEFYEHDSYRKMLTQNQQDLSIVGSSYINKKHAHATDLAFSSSKSMEFDPKTKTLGRNSQDMTRWRISRAEIMSDRMENYLEKIIKNGVVSPVDEMDYAVKKQIESMENEAAQKGKFLSQSEIFMIQKKAENMLRPSMELKESFLNHLSNRGLLSKDGDDYSVISSESVIAYKNETISKTDIAEAVISKYGNADDNSIVIETKAEILARAAKKARTAMYGGKNEHMDFANVEYKSATKEMAAIDKAIRRGGIETASIKAMPASYMYIAALRNDELVHEEDGRIYASDLSKYKEWSNGEGADIRREIAGEVKEHFLKNNTRSAQDDLIDLGYRISIGDEIKMQSLSLFEKAYVQHLEEKSFVKVDNGQVFQSKENNKDFYKYLYTSEAKSARRDIANGLTIRDEIKDVYLRSDLVNANRRALESSLQKTTNRLLASEKIDPLGKKEAILADAMKSGDSAKISLAERSVLRIEQTEERYLSNLVELGFGHFGKEGFVFNPGKNQEFSEWRKTAENKQLIEKISLDAVGFMDERSNDIEIKKIQSRKYDFRHEITQTSVKLERGEKVDVAGKKEAILADAMKSGDSAKISLAERSVLRIEQTEERYLSNLVELGFGHFGKEGFVFNPGKNQEFSEWRKTAENKQLIEKISLDAVGLRDEKSTIKEQRSFKDKHLLRAEMAEETLLSSKVLDIAGAKAWAKNILGSSEAYQSHISEINGTKGYVENLKEMGFVDEISEEKYRIKTGMHFEFAAWRKTDDAKRMRESTLDISRIKEEELIIGAKKDILSIKMQNHLIKEGLAIKEIGGNPVFIGGASIDPRKEKNYNNLSLVEKQLLAYGKYTLPENYKNDFANGYGQFFEMISTHIARFVRDGVVKKSGESYELNVGREAFGDYLKANTAKEVKAKLSGAEWHIDAESEKHIKDAKAEIFSLDKNIAEFKDREAELRELAQRHWGIAKSAHANKQVKNQAIMAAGVTQAELKDFQIGRQYQQLLKSEATLMRDGFIDMAARRKFVLKNTMSDDKKNGFLASQARLVERLEQLVDAGMIRKDETNHEKYHLEVSRSKFAQHRNSDLSNIERGDIAQGVWNRTIRDQVFSMAQARIDATLIAGGEWNMKAAINEMKGHGLYTKEMSEVFARLEARYDRLHKEKFLIKTSRGNYVTADNAGLKKYIGSLHDKSQMIKGETASSKDWQTKKTIQEATSFFSYGGRIDNAIKRFTKINAQTISRDIGLKKIENSFNRSGLFGAALPGVIGVLAGTTKIAGRLTVGIVYKTIKALNSKTVEAMIPTEKDIKLSANSMADLVARRTKFSTRLEQASNLEKDNFFERLKSVENGLTRPKSKEFEKRLSSTQTLGIE